MSEKEDPKDECWCCQGKLEYFGQICPVCRGGGLLQGGTVTETLFEKLKIDSALLLEDL